MRKEDQDISSLKKEATVLLNTVQEPTCREGHTAYGKHRSPHMVPSAPGWDSQPAAPELGMLPPPRHLKGELRIEGSLHEVQPSSQKDPSQSPDHLLN